MLHSQVSCYGACIRLRDVSIESMYEITALPYQCNSSSRCLFENKNLHLLRDLSKNGVVFKHALGAGQEVDYLEVECNIDVSIFNEGTYF